MNDRAPPMKPTPTQIEAAAEAIYNLFTYDEPGEKPKWIERGNSFKQEDARRYAAAALSVPAAAVVGEPEPSTLLGDIRQKWMDLETDTEFEDWLFSSELEALAAPSAPDGWQPDAGQQWYLDRIGEEITAGRKQNALTYLSFAFAEAASRISQQDAELERMRRELADMTISRDGYAKQSMAREAEGRRKAFIEAAEIAEETAQGSDHLLKAASQAKDIQGALVHGEGVMTARIIATALRRKAEETGR